MYFVAFDTLRRQTTGPTKLSRAVPPGDQIPNGQSLNCLTSKGLGLN
jgi:hypothetical protein